MTARLPLFAAGCFFIASHLIAQDYGANTTRGAGFTRNSSPSPTSGYTAPNTFAGTGAEAITGIAPGNYVLQPQDTIKIDLFDEPTLSTTTRISADGTISMPLIGDLNIGKMTVDDAQTAIENAYLGDYLVSPHATISVISYTQRQIFVHGHVGRPGPVPIPPERELTVSEAIAYAGGVTRMGRKGNIRIRRLKEGGKTEIIMVDLTEILEDEDEVDVILQDGDQVIVAERII